MISNHAKLQDSMRIFNDRDKVLSHPRTAPGAILRIAQPAFPIDALMLAADARSARQAAMNLEKLHSIMRPALAIFENALWFRCDPECAEGWHVIMRS
jgi:hypothetical protein